MRSSSQQLWTWGAGVLVCRFRSWSSGVFFADTGIKKSHDALRERLCGQSIPADTWHNVTDGRLSVVHTFFLATHHVIFRVRNRSQTSVWLVLSVRLPVCLSIRLSVCLSVCLSVYLSVCLSACLSVCLPVCLCDVCRCIRFCSRSMHTLLELYKNTCKLCKTLKDVM